MRFAGRPDRIMTPQAQAQLADLQQFERRLESTIADVLAEADRGSTVLDLARDCRRHIMPYIDGFIANREQINRRHRPMPLRFLRSVSGFDDSPDEPD